MKKLQLYFAILTCSFSFSFAHAQTCSPSNAVVAKVVHFADTLISYATLSSKTNNIEQYAMEKESFGVLVDLLDTNCFAWVHLCKIVLCDERGNKEVITIKKNVEPIWGQPLGSLKKCTGMPCVYDFYGTIIAEHSAVLGRMFPSPDFYSWQSQVIAVPERTITNGLARLNALSLKTNTDLFHVIVSVEICIHLYVNDNEYIFQKSTPWSNLWQVASGSGTPRKALLPERQGIGVRSR